MTDSPAQQRDAAVPSTAVALPRATATLLAQLGDDWTHHVNHATGVCTYGSLSEDTDGEGKRRRVETEEDVDSVRLVASHRSDRRAFDATWIKRAGRSSWTLDSAWRLPHAGELNPVRLTATELASYVAQPPPPDPAAQAQLAADLAELAQHRARWEANQDVWVPVPMRWETLQPGAVVIVADGSAWAVLAAEPGPIVRLRCGAQEWAGRPPGPTAQVLVPVAERDALTLLRSELGSRVMDNTERRTA